MPNIEIKKGQATPPASQTDVFDAMRHEMNRLFDSFGRGFPAMPSLLRGSDGDLVGFDIDVRDEGAAIVIEADIPGVEEKDVAVTLANGVLSISGEKKTAREERKDSYYLAERSFGAFQRSLRLPPGIDEDKIDARFEKGVLKITAAKRPEAVKAERKIEIKKS